MDGSITERVLPFSVRETKPQLTTPLKDISLDQFGTPPKLNIDGSLIT
jgi:hypothetical protein